MNESPTRVTKYSKAVLEVLGLKHHATNSELLLELRKIYPELSATTVHRVTSRLVAQSKIAEAPADVHGSMRYDANCTPHDHFVCMHCGGIRDLDVAERLIPHISEALGGCKITGRLLVHGSCEHCFVTNKEG